MLQAIPNHVHPKLVDQVDAFNKRANEGLTAIVSLLRGADRFLDAELFDPTDWIGDETQKYTVAVGHVDVYLHGEFYYRVPTKLVVYFDDHEYLEDMCTRALETIAEGRREGVLT